MRPPELTDPQSTDDMPMLMRRIFLVAAGASIPVAVLAAYMTLPGFKELLGLKHDAWLGGRDRALVVMAGLPTAVVGIIAAWQGFSGLPKRLSLSLATLGLLLNLGVLLGAGIPFLIDYLKNV